MKQTSVAQRGNPEIRQDGQSVDDIMAKFMCDHEVPGMAVAIVQAPISHGSPVTG